MPQGNLPLTFFPDIFPPSEIRILGAGRFGRLAVERLKPRFPDAVFSITDRNGPKVEPIASQLGIRYEIEDAVQSLTRSTLSESIWLIPAVPVHLGFEWLMVELEQSGEVQRPAVPEAVSRMVPNPITSPSGTLYASFATFICPDYCSEPSDICTHTGEARPGNLFEVFEAVRAEEMEVAVLRSWQLAPGVGGYPVRSLNALLSRIRERPGKYLVATSCRCHGVMDALEWKRK